MPFRRHYVVAGWRHAAFDAAAFRRQRYAVAATRYATLPPLRRCQYAAAMLRCLMPRAADTLIADAASRAAAAIRNTTMA